MRLESEEMRLVIRCGRVRETGGACDLQSAYQCRES